MPTRRATARFSRWDVVAVPFPYTDKPVRQHRPALVVSTAELEELHGLLWVAMITAAQNRRWPDDVVIGDLKMAGLPIPSIIRPSKLATVESTHAERRGTIQLSTRRQVASALARYFPRTA